MKKRLAIAGATVLTLILPIFVFARPAQAAVGLRVSGSSIVEATGQNFVMRGVSHAHVWYPTQTSAFANIKSLGANTVRVVLGSGQRWGPTSAAEVAQVITLCETNRLICVLEVHDTTGFGEEGAAATLDQAANYWISVQSVLTGHENTVVLNIGNEPYGNNSATAWTAATTNAIVKLRNAGLDHLIMVDAPNWGQDWQFVMRDSAQSVFTADPDRNTVFSIHMYGVFDTAAEVIDYLARFRSAGLPLVIGEFGHNHSDGNPDEDTIMAEAQTRGIGYIGWSWSGNGGGVEYLDMVTNFNVGQLTSWGQRIFNGANGIAATSRQACVYGGCGGGDTTPPTTPGTLTSSSLTSTSVNLSWGASTDNVGVTGYDILRAPGASGGTFATVGASTTTSFTNTGLTANTTYRYQVRARDAAGNLSAVSNTITVTTPDGGSGGGSCAVTYRVVGSWPGGFQGDVRIANTGTAAINGWTLGWSFANGQTITNMWGGTPTVSGGQVTVVNAAYTASIAANGSVTIGFIGGWNGTNNNPTAFTLNGSGCATG